MAEASFDKPQIDWDSPALYQEYCRFKTRVEFTFAGPLGKKSAKEKAGWLGMWLVTQGREIFQTFGLSYSDKEDFDYYIKIFYFFEKRD